MKERREKILKLENVHKSFGSKHVHRGVNLELNQGETIGLLGGSGTGKSVLLREIIGLEFIDKGKIIFKGQDIQNLNEKELQKIRLEISYSFQSGALFDSVNVFENIAYPLFEHTKMSLNEIRSKVAEILEMVDLKGIEELMPSDLSGGMQKRVGMARAMIMRPEIILYDEPTAGLDPTNTKNVVDIMKKMTCLGYSSIFVTHDIPAALELCQRLIILNDGIVAFNDGPEEFKKSNDPIVLKYKQEVHYAGSEGEK